VTFTLTALITLDVVTVNVADFFPAGIVTVAGTCTVAGTTLVTSITVSALLAAAIVTCPSTD
jgi:small-conductance mechanosensitive channel